MFHIRNKEIFTLNKTFLLDIPAANQSVTIYNTAQIIRFRHITYLSVLPVIVSRSAYFHNAVCFRSIIKHSLGIRYNPKALFIIDIQIRNRLRYMHGTKQRVYIIYIRKAMQIEHRECTYILHPDKSVAINTLAASSRIIPVINRMRSINIVIALSSVIKGQRSRSTYSQTSVRQIKNT